MTTPSRPLVSIIRVVTPGATAWNTLARARLAKHTPLSHEVLDSVCETSYGAAANRGAAQARSDHLVVMRGDTLVGPNWLEPLWSAASRWDAIVTPLVVGFNGAVIDAGYVATRGADLIALGRGTTNADPVWSFVRDVTSPSPTCFLVARHAFLAAGGFDQSVTGVPLVETADLAFTLRERGYRALFQPASTVQAEAPPSAATAFRLGEAFRRRWQRALARLPAYAGGTLLRELVELRDGHAPARLLIVDDRVPHVDRGGGDPRMHRMLMELLALWPSLRLTLFASMPDNGLLYARPLRQAGIEVVFGENLDAWLASRRCSFDVILISRPRPVLDTIRTTQPQARIVYDMEALHYRRYQRMLQVASPDDARGLADAVSNLLELETKLVAAADVVIAVSDDDRSFARLVAPTTPSFVVSHASEAPPSVPPFETRRDMIFFGAFWNPGSPNEDAVLRLARHVMPLVWAEDPSIRLLIVGADPTPAVQRLDGGNITVRGYISNPIEVLTRARVHVVPIRMGAGIKLRLIDSMAAGLPFVTTTVGAEGLPLGPLAATIVADAPADLARRALALYRNRELWTGVQQAIRGLAVAQFSAAVLRRQLADALAPVGLPPPDDRDARRPTTVKSGAIPVAQRCE